MSDLLRSPKGRIGAIVAGGLLVVAAVWFLLVSPQKSKAAELETPGQRVAGRALAAPLALAQPSASVTVKPSDLYRLTKALPDDTGMSGDPARRQPARRQQRARVPLDRADRAGARDRLRAAAARPSSSRGASATSRSFLGDLRTLVTVRKGRLDARGRLYSVTQVDMARARQRQEVPDRAGHGDAQRLLVQRPGAGTPAPDPSTTTDPSSSGTVAAGATP